MGGVEGSIFGLEEWLCDGRCDGVVFIVGFVVTSDVMMVDSISLVTLCIHRNPS